MNNVRRKCRLQDCDAKLTKQSRFAPVLVGPPNEAFGSARKECENTEFGNAAYFCISTRGALCRGLRQPSPDRFQHPAASQLLDPGWQLVYSGQPNYAGSSPGGDGGLIQHVFGDGAGQRAIPRPLSAGPAYYQQQPPPQPPQGYQPTAPVYYQQQPHTYPGGPAYYRQVPAQQIPPQQARGYQPAPAYYQRVPPQQQRVYPGGPVYYQQGPAQQQARSYQPAPTSYQEQPQQQRGSQPTPAYYQQQVPPQTGAQPAPVYSQQLALPQRAYQPAPVYYQGPAQRPGLFQPAAMSYKQAPTQQQAGASQPPPAYYQQPQQQDAYQLAPAQLQPVTRNDPAQGYAPSGYGDMAHAPADPKFERQVVDYQGNEPPGTIIIDTPHFFLYLVADGGKAVRYGIGVGRPGLHLGRRQGDFGHARMAGLVSADRDAPAPAGSATLYARRARQSARCRARSISAPRSIASTAPTNPGPSARRCRRAVFACATRMSSTFTVG